MLTDSNNVVEQVQDSLATAITPAVEATEGAVAENAGWFATWITEMLGDLNFGGDPEFWGEMLLMTAIGFSVVFVVLVLLIFIMKIMGFVFTRQKKAKTVATKGATAAEEHDAISDQEIAAAIITALKLYKSNLHDQESEILTINRITRAYSPWSSKIHGLTQLPERK